MSERNRSQGWTYAKRSGHRNENAICNGINRSPELRKRLKIGMGLPCEVHSATVGGIKEKNVPCILGETTKAKTDLALHLSNSTQVGVSIKKSGGGQAFLIGVDRFLALFTRFRTAPKHIFQGEARGL